MTAINLRLYCQGIGDANLIEIDRGPGQQPYRILIDCGLHSSTQNGTPKLRTVVADIVKRCTPAGGGKPRLDVIVATHEHWDHISAFANSLDLFQAVDVGEVWMAWSEDPADPLASKLDKYKADAAMALAGASQRMGDDPRHAAVAQGIDGILGFNFGAAGEKVRDARENLKGLAPGRVRYLDPGQLAPLPPELGVRAYVLAPPRDLKMLGLTDSKTDSYGISVDAGWAAAAALLGGFGAANGTLTPDADVTAPFDNTEGELLSALIDGSPPTPGDKVFADFASFITLYYSGEASPALQPQIGRMKDQSWRRIDADWLAMASDLALQLDSRTNNSSLVLALEMADTSEVLLFAADAQIGNWRSWPDVVFSVPSGTADAPRPVKGSDLLAQTVFYKVGHHGSANATRSTGGLEAMTHPGLRAFIPTDVAMAQKVHWGDIPAKELLVRLKTLTQNRVVRADQLDGVSADWVTVDPGKLFVEMKFGGAAPPATAPAAVPPKPRGRVASGSRHGAAATPRPKPKPAPAP